jgi:endonuclease/exonuclease/phosphatase (EEP) superfamily protein YafD
MGHDSALGGWRLGLWRRVRLLGLLALIGLWLPLLLRPFASVHNGLTWLLDLAVHWQWLYLLLFLPLPLLAGVWGLAHGRRWLWRWLWLLLCLPLPWLSASPALPMGQRPGLELRLLSANLSLRNPSAAGLLAWLAQTQPDLLLLQELTPALARQLQGLDAYPYRLVCAEDSPFGLGLYSRLPLAQAEVVRQDQIPEIHAAFDWQGQRVRLLLVHPMPPLSSAFHRQRDQRLWQLAGSLAQQPGPRLLAGDLNASPWSSLFVGLDGLGLRRAAGLAPSWPAVGAGLLGIPIDQVLASGHWHLLEHELGPNIGSDHRPVLLRLQLVDEAI